MIDEEKTDDSGILLGQMCYDELEPIKPQESQVENKIVAAADDNSLLKFEPPADRRRGQWKNARDVLE